MRVLKLDDYKYLREIERISDNNDFIGYIVDIVSSNDYRGIQCSQHNRLTYKYFSTLIDIIYTNAGTDMFDIHVGDDKGGGGVDEYHPEGADGKYRALLLPAEEKQRRVQKQQEQ